VRKNPGQRAANVYSAGGTTYNAPKYYAPVGDALIMVVKNKIKNPKKHVEEGLFYRQPKYGHWYKTRRPTRPIITLVRQTTANILTKTYSTTGSAKSSVVLDLN
jgi:hypothetical protein